LNEERLGKDAELLGKNQEIARLNLARQTAASLARQTAGEQARVLQDTEERLLGEVARAQAASALLLQEDIKALEAKAAEAAEEGRRNAHALAEMVRS